MGYVEELVDFTHAKVTFDELMKKHTGYGVGGKARYFIFVIFLTEWGKCVNITVDMYALA